MTDQDNRADLLAQIETQRGHASTYWRHWTGTNGAGYLSSDARKALDQRIAHLGVNFPRLVVSSIVDRLDIVGFRRGDTPAADYDDELWQWWDMLDMAGVSDRTHTARLLYGQAGVTVWANQAGEPVVTADSPWNLAVETDPATGDPIRAVRTWQRDAGRRQVALVFTLDKVVQWEADTTDLPAAAGAWRATRTADNPYDTLPVVPFIRRVSTDDYAGTSAVADILDLTDAVSKVLGDSMVTSEYYARPRRWATGLEIQEDEDGNQIDPFGDNRFLQNEAPEGKFGQLDPVRLDGYSDMIATLTQQIGALTGLPPHYLGLHGDQPANADSVRAAEAQLTSRVRTEMRHLNRPWAKVAALIRSTVTGEATVPASITTRFGSPEIRTPGQAADAAAKLREIGLPMSAILADTLGYTEEQIAQIRRQQRADTLDQAGVNDDELADL